MTLTTAAIGLMATLLGQASARDLFPLHHHRHDAPRAEFRDLQDTESLYNVEVAGISLMDVDTRIPDVSMPFLLCLNIVKHIIE